MYNSSSEVERDFSQQNNLFANPHNNRKSQLTLQNQMSVISATSLEGNKCEVCLEAIETRETYRKENPTKNISKYRSFHCHCSLLVPEKELINFCKDGDPNRKMNQDRKDKADQKLIDDEIANELNKDDKEKEAADLVKEVVKFRKKYRDEQMELEKEKAQKALEKAEQLKRLKVTLLPKPANNSIPSTSTSRKPSNSQEQPKTVKPKKVSLKSGQVKKKTTSVETIHLFKPKK